MKASFAAASAFSGSSLGTEELSPLLLGTNCHATHFANFLALLPSYSDSPAIVFCLPRSGPVSLMCQRAENITAFSHRVLEDVPLRDLLVFWLHQALQGLDVLFSVDAIFEIILQSPITFLSKWLHPTLCSSRPSCHHPSLEEAAHRERLTTKNLLPSSRYCFVFAMIVLSFALHIWSSTSKCPCSSSNGEHEFCFPSGPLFSSKVHKPFFFF